MDLNKLKNKSDNVYSQALFAIGWIVIGLGCIGSIVLGKSFSDYGDFNFAVFLAGLLSTAISGFLVLGIAEIISILNDNRRLLASMAQNGGMASGDSLNSDLIAEELPEL